MSGSTPVGTAPGAASGAGVTSPCINVCQMDAASGLCRGCLRTLDEIAGWSRAGDAEKLRILAAIDRRRTVQATDTAAPRPVANPLQGESV